MYRGKTGRAEGRRRGNERRREAEEGRKRRVEEERREAWEDVSLLFLFWGGQSQPRRGEKTYIKEWGYSLLGKKTS